MAYYSRPEELLVEFTDRLNAEKGLLGIRYVATQDENLLPEYPALQVSMGPVVREDHGTQRFLLTFEMSFWIYHANFEATHATRTIEDMELTTNVVRFLHLPENRALYSERDSENKIVGGSGRVSQEIPGATTRETGARVITTRLIWHGQSQVNYADS
jgi:hypothetical protein